MSGRIPQSAWPQWFGSGSANRAIIGAAILAVAAVGSWIWWQQVQSSAQVSLIPAIRLQETELARIELAFGAASLNDFTIVNGQILVPRNQRDRYAKVLQSCDALPHSNRDIYEPKPHSPWATSEQHREASLLNKKKIIRQLVLQLGCVADVIVDYDEIVEPGWPPETKRTAAIVVRPKSGRLLEPYQVDAIRKTICGSVAGLHPDDIVITDIAAGHAYVGSKPSADSSDSDALLHVERARLEQRLADQLSSFGPGILTSVRLALPKPKKEPADTLPTELVTGEADTPVANQPVAVAGKNESEPAATKDTDTSPAAQSIDIHVRIPVECVRKFAGKSSLETDPPIGTISHRFDQLKERVTSALQPILNASGQQWIVQDLQIEMIELPTNELTTSETANGFWSNWDRMLPFLALGLAVALGTLLLVQRRSEPELQRAESATATARQTVSAAQGNPRSGSAEIPEEMRQKLRKMVHDDPDRAAEVFKKWIRDAA